MVTLDELLYILSINPLRLVLVLASAWLVPGSLFDLSGFVSVLSSFSVASTFQIILQPEMYFRVLRILSPCLSVLVWSLCLPVRVCLAWGLERPLKLRLNRKML